MGLQNISILGIVLLCVQFVFGIPVKNGVIGDPYVLCGPRSIKINFLTENNFEGHVFVKSKFNDPQCRTTASGTNEASIDVSFDSCGVQRLRSANPPGIFVSSTVIITFHPNFITKVDKAYMIQCFYMEADKVVSTELQVQMLTPSFQTQSVPMPTCIYEVLDQGPNGQPVRYAQIGQKVYHKWTCVSEYTDIFCMTVHSCKVDDGSEDIVDLIDSDGCSIDRHLLSNLDYLSDLMAGQQSHVFKYADRASLYFDCQIAISIKEPNGICVTPTCNSRNKRESVLNSTSLQIRESRTEASLPKLLPDFLWEETCFTSLTMSSFIAFNAIFLSASGVMIYKSVTLMYFDEVDF